TKISAASFARRISRWSEGAASTCQSAEVGWAISAYLRGSYDALWARSAVNSTQTPSVRKRAVPRVSGATRSSADAWARRHDRHLFVVAIVPGAFAHPTTPRNPYGNSSRQAYPPPAD